MPTRAEIRDRLERAESGKRAAIADRILRAQDPRSAPPTEQGLRARPPSTRSERQSAEEKRQLEERLGGGKTGRIAMEAGGGIAAAMGAAQLFPQLRGVKLAQIGLRSLAAAAGEFGGSLAAETIDPTESPLRSAGQAAVRGGLGEGLGGLAVKLGSRLFVRPAKTLEPGARETIKIVAEKGGVVTPGLARSGGIDILENIAEASLFGGKRVLRVREEAISIVKEAADDFVSKFGRIATEEEFGFLLKDIVKDGAKAFKVEGKVMANTLDALVGAPRVDYLVVKRGAQRLMKELSAGLPAPKTMSILKAIIDKPGKVSFAEAQILRSNLLAVGRQGSELIPGQAPAAAKVLANLVDKAMEEGVRGVGRNARLFWRKFNKFWRVGKEEFEGNLIKAIIRRDPEQLIRLTRTGSPSVIRRLRKLVVRVEVKPGRSAITGAARSKTWKKVQGATIKDFMNQATDPGTGELVGKKLVAVINKYGDEGLRELFPVGIGPITLKKVAKALRTVQASASGEKTGSIFIQLKQAGAVSEVPGVLLGVTQFVSTELATAVLVGPFVLSRIFTNPTLARMLTIGLKSSPGTAAGTRAAAQFFAALSRIELLPEERSAE